MGLIKHKLTAYHLSKFKYIDLITQAEELQLEKSRFEETVGSMSEQLMNFVEKMNKMEKECVSHTTLNLLQMQIRKEESLRLYSLFL